MSADRGPGWAAWVIAAMAALAVIAGLALVGGPAQGRKERRDDTRAEDLSRLSAHIGCLSDDGAMPADLAETDRCPGPVRRADPFTGAPYRIEPLDRGSYRLCAGFELADKAATARFAARRRAGDCVVYELPPPPDPRAAGDG